MEHHNGESLQHMGDLPSMAAYRYGDKTALSFMGQETSFNELEARANSVANVLVDNGVEPGNRVGLYIPNTDQFPEAYFGTLKTGAIPVPLNLRMDPNTLEFVLQDGDVDHMIGSPLLAGGMDTEEGRIIGPTELAGRAGVSNVYVSGVSDDGVINYSQATAEASDEFDTVDRDFEDVAVQPYTSGTTGKPKGVLLTHKNLLSTIEAYAKGGLPIDPDDSIVLVLPLFHIYALNAIQGTYLYNGAKMHMIPRPDPDMILQTISNNDVTNFAGVPALYNMMWQVYREDPDAYDMESLTDVICAAAPLADDTRRTIEEAWGVPMTEGWGMTETGPAGTVEPSRGVRKSAGCIGPALRGIDLKLVDPETRETRVSADDLEPNPSDDIDFTDEEQVTGEIAINGPTVFDGYYNRPEKTSAVFDDDGWFYTEDIARVDEDGYFWMVDRADDMIIAGGENIYPAEVEDALYEHPDVAEAAVVAAPHEIKGEAPVAFVVLEEGADLSEKELRDFTLDHVATYAHPRQIWFIDELPRSATQKVQRYKLEEEVEERLEGGALGSSEDL
ncbi:class I adenylate-forming enzyme family protein [Natronomonas sp.]|uniref:class I adenylate-forming enzyme family protein n=1 Tax=Natronomonas sp. TaxID=2184060 RepID=UPI002FC317E3